MEGFSASVYDGIRGYWRRKGYQRVNSTRRKRKMRVVDLGSPGPAGGTVRRRRFWRIKLTPRLNLKLRFSPKKLLLGLRDAYVNMMLRIANTSVVSSGFGGAVAGSGAAGFGMRLKEYDERMILEIYKSIVMAQPGLAPQLGIKA
ncbi:hypothetical protein F511_11069 [Dorcoceras hygrometricum]|uniref:Uncharacterized protein n=1 Tax=Dorcoceras hygrometricum TaxID=472368 RepID=A0A2Z7AJ64_9LAMI|nr:hypothetical protein F511_11069 [Dorcoceras hygrometricum]